MISGSSTLKGNVTANGNISGSGDVTVTGYVAAEGNIYTKSNLNVTGAVFAGGNLSGSGNTTIADNSVTAAKTDISIVSGDIIYGNGTDSWTRLAKGTDGQVLTLASGVPSWSSDSVTQTKGTWNPTFTNFGSPSYTTREGGWIRTGDLLVVNFYINYTGGTASSTAYIGDLPVDVGNEPKEVTGFVSVSTSGTTGGENKTYLLQPTSASTKGFYFQPIREDLTAAQIQGTINIILGV